MLVGSIVIGVCILCIMVYLALSKKIRFRLRVAMLVALGVMITAVIVSLIVILLSRASVAGKNIIADMEIPTAAPASRNLLFIFIET